MLYIVSEPRSQQEQRFDNYDEALGLWMKWTTLYGSATLLITTKEEKT